MILCHFDLWGESGCWLADVHSDHKETPVKRVPPPLKMKTLLNVNTGELLMETGSSWTSSFGEVFLKTGNGFIKPDGDFIQKIGKDFSDTTNLDFFTRIDHDDLCKY